MLLHFNLVCVCVCGVVYGVSHSTHVEVREQLSESAASL